MTVNELHDFFNGFLKIENFSYDPSLNGIQIQNSRQIKKVAFAVDACEQTALEAARLEADALVVHHGLFWGHCQTLTGSHYKRVAAFIKSDLALLAYHIPLDANNPYGNNYGLALHLGLTDLQPFGTWHGMTLGVKGTFVQPLAAESLAEKLSAVTGTAARSFCFGKERVSTVGIISGGAGEDVDQAVAEGLDAYITGEFAHEQFHYIKEMQINVIAGGHYGTEKMGVSLLKEKVEKELGLETVFLDFPTGL